MSKDEDHQHRIILLVHNGRVIPVQFVHEEEEDVPDVTMPEGTSPLDMPTVPMSEALADLDVKYLEDADFMNEVIPMLRKRIVWDIVPDDYIAKWAKYLSISSGSKEGDIIEKAAGLERRMKLAPLQPLLNVAATTAGDVLTRTRMLTDAEQEGDLPDSGTITVKAEHDVTMAVVAGVHAVLANLLELGVIQYGGVGEGV